MIGQNVTSRLGRQIAVPASQLETRAGPGIVGGGGQPKIAERCLRSSRSSACFRYRLFGIKRIGEAALAGGPAA